VGRGGRILIDRVVEEKPRFGNEDLEIYRGDLPISAIRHKPVEEKAGSVVLLPETPRPDIALPGMNELTVSASMSSAKSINPFGKVNMAVATSIKRSYQDVMQDYSAVSVNDLTPALSHTMGSDVVVHANLAKRMVLNRNSTNDQVQFFV
jgi:hypothetical protein